MKLMLKQILPPNVLDECVQFLIAEILIPLFVLILKKSPSQIAMHVFLLPVALSLYYLQHTKPKKKRPQKTC